MTGAINSFGGGGAIGDVYVNVSSRVKETDARKAVADIDAMANKEFTRLGQENGQNWSRTFSNEVKNALGADAFGKPNYRSGSVSNMLRGSISNAVHDAFRDTRNIVDDAAITTAGNRSGGLFSRGFGRIFRDMFGSIFGSGGFLSGLFDFKSSPILQALKPITDLLGGIFSGPSMGGSVGGPILKGLQAAFQVSAMGTMVAYITAAVYGLQSFISLLYIVPSLLFSIGLQVGALMFAFHGLGTLISQVFAAKSIEEVDTALQGVNQVVAIQLRQLYQWKVLFGEIAKSAQNAFFSNIGATRITEVFNNIGPQLQATFTNVAGALGRVFDNMLKAFANPTFQKLIQVLGDSTVKWLDGFGPALDKLITGFNQLGIATAPFLDWFGEKFNKAISDFGDAMTRVGENKDFQDFLERAKTLMPEFIHLLGAIVDLIIVIVQKFGEADDKFKSAFGMDFLTFLKKMTEAFTQIVGIFGSGFFLTMIEILAVLVTLFFGFLTAFLMIGVSIQGTFYFIHDAVIGLIALIHDLGTTIGNAAYDTWQFFSNIGSNIRKWWDEQIAKVREKIHSLPAEIGGVFTDIGSKFKEAWDNLISDAYDAGKNIMSRLAQGIKDAAKGAVEAVKNGVTDIRDYIMGHSPVRKGPLSGAGDPFYAGKNIMNRLALGINDGAPKVTNAMSNVTSTIVFGPGAIQNVYNNANPNNAAAHAQIMANQTMGLMSRDTRLAVRTLGAV